MNQEEIYKNIENTLNRAKELLIVKGKEYAINKNPFHNFDIAKGFLKEGTNKKALWGFLVKHLVSLKDYCEDTITLNENQLNEKCMDIIIYTCLLKEMK